MTYRILLFVLLVGLAGCSSSSSRSRVSASAGDAGETAAGGEAGDPAEGGSGGLGSSTTGGSSGAAAGGSGAGSGTSGTGNAGTGSADVGGSGNGHSGVSGTGSVEITGGAGGTGGASGSGGSGAGEPTSGYGGETPTGGSAGEAAQGGSGGEGGAPPPSCTVREAVWWLPNAFELDDWSFERPDMNMCASCYSSPCMQCTLTWGGSPTWLGDSQARFYSISPSECFGTFRAGECGATTTCQLEFEEEPAVIMISVDVDLEPCGDGWCATQVEKETFPPYIPTCLGNWGSETSFENALFEAFAEVVLAHRWPCQ